MLSLNFASAYPVRIVSDISEYSPTTFSIFGQQFTVVQQAVCMGFVGLCENQDRGYAVCTYNEQTEECFCQYGYYPDVRIDWTLCRSDVYICPFEGYANSRYCWAGDVYDKYFYGIYPDCQNRAELLFKCTYGCEDGECTTEECIEGPVTESMCREGDVKQKWQDDGCGTYWKTIDSCANDEVCFEARCVKEDQPTQTLPTQPEDITKTCSAEDGCVLDCIPPDPDCGEPPTPTCDIVCTEECTQLNSVSCECEAVPGCITLPENTGDLSQVCGEDNFCEEGLVCEEGICKKAPIPLEMLIVLGTFFIGGIILVVVSRLRKGKWRKR